MILFYIKEIGMADYTIDPVISNLGKHKAKVIHSSFLNGKQEFPIPIKDIYKNIEFIDFRINKIRYILKLFNNNCSTLMIFGHNSLLDFSFSILCSILEIKSIYIQHGRFGEESKFYVDNFFQLLKKYFCYFVFYFRVLISGGSDVLHFSSIYLKHKAEWSFNSINLFFDEHSLKYLNCNGKKHIIGNPTNLLKTGTSPDEDTISYIQQGFIAHGITTTTRQEEKKYFKDLIAICNEKEFSKFQFFLHPRERLEDYL